jgi:hypothetical protein
MNQIQKPSWWGRNWKWAAPVGCFSFLILAAGIAVSVMLLVLSLVKSSGAYTQAVEKAKSNEAVIFALGSPIKEGYFPTGNIHVDGPSGNAEIAVLIAGPKGQGTIFAEAKKSVGEWSFSKLLVQIDQTNQRINLLDEKK